MNTTKPDDNETHPLVKVFKQQKQMVRQLEQHLQLLRATDDVNIELRATSKIARALMQYFQTVVDYNPDGNNPLGNFIKAGEELKLRTDLLDPDFVVMLMYALLGGDEASQVGPK